MDVVLTFFAKNKKKQMSDNKDDENDDLHIVIKLEDVGSTRITLDTIDDSARLPRVNKQYSQTVNNNQIWNNEVSKKSPTVRILER